MTCKDCLHYGICNIYVSLQAFEKKAAEEGAEKCSMFADKSLYIKMPCKVGDTVYTIGITRFERTATGVLAVWKVEKGTVGDMEYHKSGDKWWITGRPYGKCRWGVNAFGTREEAEKALKKRNGEQ